MTRAFTDSPIWTWKCDRCGRSSGDLATHQSQLPDPDEMRRRGWYIADVYGDLCSRCYEGVA
jgi:hypothetical protein